MLTSKVSTISECSKCCQHLSPTGANRWWVGHKIQHKFSLCSWIDPEFINQEVWVDRVLTSWALENFKFVLNVLFSVLCCLCLKLLHLLLHNNRFIYRNNKANWTSSLYLWKTINQSRGVSHCLKQVWSFKRFPLWSCSVAAADTVPPRTCSSPLAPLNVLYNADRRIRHWSRLRTPKCTGLLSTMWTVLYCVIQWKIQVGRCTAWLVHMTCCVLRPMQYTVWVMGGMMNNGTAHNHPLLYSPPSNQYLSSCSGRDQVHSAFLSTESTWRFITYSWFLHCQPFSHLQGSFFSLEDTKYDGYDPLLCQNLHPPPFNILLKRATQTPTKPPLDNYRWTSPFLITVSKPTVTDTAALCYYWTSNTPLIQFKQQGKKKDITAESHSISLETSHLFWADTQRWDYKDIIMLPSVLQRWGGIKWAGISV